MATVHLIKDTPKGDVMYCDGQEHADEPAIVVPDELQPTDTICDRCADLYQQRQEDLTCCV